MASARVVLGSVSLTAGNGGIARVARLMGKVLAEEAAASRIECRGIVLGDPLPEDIYLPMWSARNSRLRFVERMWLSAVWATHFAYGFAGTARSHCRLPGFRRPFLTFIHGIEIWENARRDHIAATQRADLLLANSAFTREKADRLHGGYARAKVCWLATEDDGPPSRPGDPRRGRPTVLIIGRVMGLVRDKGHEAILRAWPFVLEKVPDARLVVVGTGPGLEALHSQAAQLPAGSVEIRGFVPEAKMPEIWQEASVFAMPSRGEGFGLVYIEAMRYGLPVLASVHDAAPEVNIDGITGYNVDLDRPAELTDRLIELLRDRDRAAALGQAGLQRWREHFRYSLFRQRFLNLVRPWLNCEDRINGVEQRTNLESKS